MKIANYAVVLIILGLFAIGGCTDGGDGGSTGDAFVGGTKGLELDFMEGGPPGVIYDQGTMGFAIQVKLENKGEYDMQPGEYVVSIVGIDPSEFGITNPAGTDPNEPISGMEKDADGDVIPGGIVYWNFDSVNGYTGIVHGDTTFNIRADTCYKYQSKAATMMCVKDDLLDIEDDPVCLVRESKNLDNAGSPIQITSFREESAGADKVRLSFTISHRGSGLISNDAACSDDLGYENKVELEVITNLPTNPVCNFGDATGPSGEVTILENGQRTISCTQAIPANTASYEKVVTILLDYYYKDHVSQTLTVKHVG